MSAAPEIASLPPAAGRWRPWGLAAGACALGWATLLAGLGSFGLLGPDEPRYAAIAAGMARNHHWITPRLWGQVWLEKPVLYYWLAAISDRIAHIGAASSRLPSALLAAAMLLGMYFFLRKMHSGRAGMIAVLAGLTSIFIIGFGRAATTDMPLTATFALGMMALFLWLKEDRLLWLNLAAVGFALAMLAKGPVAVVLGALALLGYAATQRDWRLWPRLFCFGPITLFFAITAPWYVAAEIKNSGFFHIFFLQQNLERLATNRFQHPQPVWFFLPVILLAVFPWTAWLGLPLGAGIRRLRRLGWSKAWEGRDAPLKFFLLCWLLAPLAFFSVSESKLPGYILPAVPAVVALIAVYAAERWEHMPRWVLAVTAVLAGVLPTAVRWTPWFLEPRALRLPWTMLLRDGTGVAIAVVCVVVLLALALRRRQTALVAAVCVLVGGSVLALTRAPLSHDIDVALSGEPLGRALFAQCGTALPEHCGMLPVYTWKLNRDRLYGAQFVVQGEFAEWAGAATDALVILPRGSIMPFEMGAARGYNIAVQPRFIPPEARRAPPWVVVRVRRAPGKSPAMVMHP